MYGATLGNHRYNFSNLATLLAKASPLRSGDILAGVAAQSGEERVATQFALADLPLCALLEDHLISYESDEITRLIVDMHDAKAFGFRDWAFVGRHDTRCTRGRRAWRSPGAEA
jgi:ethanolamine ammonia-lyase large subunit